MKCANGGSGKIFKLQDWELTSKTLQRSEGSGKFPEPLPTLWLVAASSSKAQRLQVSNFHAINILMQSMNTVTFSCWNLGNLFSSRLLLLTLKQNASFHVSATSSNQRELRYKITLEKSFFVSMYLPYVLVFRVSIMYPA